jgi:hypothetical protein
MALKRKARVARAVPETRQPTLAPSPTLTLLRPRVTNDRASFPVATRDLELLSKAMATGDVVVVDIKGATREAVAKLRQQGLEGTFLATLAAPKPKRGSRRMRV